MQIDIVTKEDLNEFRGQLLEDIKSLLPTKSSNSSKSEKWLTNSEVRNLLKISQSKLLTLKIKEGLKSYKLLGTHYYLAEDIENMLKRNIIG